MEYSRADEQFPMFVSWEPGSWPCMSWSWVSGAVGTCDPLPLLSPMQQTLHVKGSPVPIPAVLLFLWQWMGGLCHTGGCVVDVQLWAWSSCVVWFSLTPCCALVIEDIGGTTGHSGTLHTPAEKKHFALTCFLLSPETRISQILTY